MKSSTIQTYRPQCLVPRRKEDRGLEILNPESVAEEIQLADDEINEAMAADADMI